MLPLLELRGTTMHSAERLAEAKDCRKARCEGIIDQIGSMTERPVDAINLDGADPLHRGNDGRHRRNA